MSIGSQWISYGARRVYVSLYDTSGLLTGDALSLVAGTPANDFLWQGVKTVSLNIPNLNNITITGDDGLQGFFLADRTDTPTMAIQMSNSIVAEENKIQGLPTYSRNQFDTLFLDPELPAQRRYVSLIIQSQAKSSAYGVPEETGWQILQVFKGTISAGVPAGLEEQTGHAVDFVMYFDRQTVWPDAVAFTIANEGVQKASGNRAGSLYRYRRTSLLGDGVATSVTLPETPAADDTDGDIFAVEVVERTAAGVVTVLERTTDYTVTPATKLVEPSVGYGGVWKADTRYVFNYKY